MTTPTPSPRPPSPTRSRRPRGRAVPRSRFRRAATWAWHLVCAATRQGRAALRWAASGVARAYYAADRWLSGVAAALRPDAEAVLCVLSVWSGATPFVYIQLWLFANAGWQGLSLWTTGRPTSPLPLDLSDLRAWGNALLLAFLIALVVFQRRAYHEWRSSTDPLLARVLYAGAAGVQGALPLLRRWLTPPRA